MTAINFPANPSNGDTHQGFVYNSTLGVWQSAGTQTAVTSFTGLSDTPSTLGTSGQIAKVNSGATALEFADPSGVTVYATADLLPGTANAGDMAFVTATNRLYLWNGSGWYNIALINTNPSISGVNSSYDLASDGTATVITITATDPEGLPITYSIASDTSGNTATVTQGTGANTNVFTITPSTNDSNAGTFSLTFRASDGVNIATAVSEFTLQFKVQNQRYTTALITATDNGYVSNKVFRDSSGNNHSITATGDATQNTFSPYRHGGYSMKTVAGSSLGIPASTDNQFTGDFTIEGWVYSSDVGDRSFYVHGSYFAFNINFGTGFNIYLNSGGASFSPTDIVPASNEWNHVALVRSGSTVSVYLNGVASATTGTNSATLGYNSIAYIGGLGTQSAGSMNGYISDFRVVNGTAVYTSNFTPPTERLTAVTNTSVFACHLPYIADGSTNDKALAANGTITLEPFAPYDTQEYAATDHGGSVYFDGSGDYLQAPAASVARGTGNWTIECWAYFHSLGTTNIIWDARTGATPTDDFLSVQSDGSFRYRSNGITVSSAGDVTTGVWHHIAQVLNNGTLKTYVDGTEVASSSQTSNLSHGAALTIGGSALDNANWCNANFADFRVVVGTAVYTSAFTPPTAPLTAITNTSLLLPFDDATIIDKSQSIKSITLNGDTTISSTQTKHLNYSMYFDGTGDRIQLPQPSLDLGSNNFTVEAWVYTTATSQQAIAGSLVYSNGTGSWLLAVNYNSNKIRFFMRHGGGTVQDAQFEAGTFPTNQWVHVAVTRDGANLRAFINGTQAGTTNTALGSNAIDNALTNYYIGDNQDGNMYWNGYISDFRATKGLARYTANFTPPTAELKG